MKLAPRSILLSFFAVLASVVASAQVVPHVAYGTLEGGTWRTTIVLVNKSSVKGTVPVTFYDPQGAARPTPANGSTASTHTVNLPANGSARVVVEDDAAPLTVGWMRAVPPPEILIGIQAVLRQKVASRPDFETLVPASALMPPVNCLVPLPDPVAVHALIYPFDNTGGYVTTVALVNSTATDRTYRMEAFDETGSSILAADVELKAGNHSAFRLDTAYPVLAGRRGTIRFNAGPQTLGVQAFLFGQSGPFTTVLPIEQ